MYEMYVLYFCTSYLFLPNILLSQYMNISSMACFITLSPFSPLFHLKSQIPFVAIFRIRDGDIVWM